MIEAHEREMIQESSPSPVIQNNDPNERGNTYNVGFGRNREDNNNNS